MKWNSHIILVGIEVRGHIVDDAPIVHISGRTFPVQIKYLSQQEPNYVEGCLQTVWDINKEEPPGDILVFLTGQEEIETACEVCLLI